MISRLFNRLRKNSIDEIYMFSTRSIWLELGVSKKLVQEKFYEYFGSDTYKITNRDEALSVLDKTLKEIQNKLYKRIIQNDSRYFVCDLIAIFDDIYKFYMNEKEARARMKEIGVMAGSAYDTFESNKQICKNIIDSTNIWFENAVLHQNLTEKSFKEKYKIDFELMLDIYIYGLTSVNYSLLNIGSLKGFGDNEFYYGLEVNPNEDIPIQSIREHPVIYFDPILSGNQNSLVHDYDLKNMDNCEIGDAFLSSYGYSFLRQIAILHSSEERIDKTRMSYEELIIHLDSLGVDGVKGKTTIQHLLLEQHMIQEQIKNDEKFIWTIGVNKTRTELKPFIKIGKSDIFMSKYLIMQAKNVWVSYSLNGGMIYTNKPKDGIQIAFEKRNKALSDRLVEVLREKLRARYDSIFDEIEVNYSVIWGKRKTNYGDFDIMFYSKSTNELFLIEAKFISDALNSSGIVSDYDKVFKDKGYYSKCRRRYDLVISEPDKLKKFIGVTGEINIHFLFVTSKPLEIELQDKDGIVTFIGLESFENYLDGKFISEDGDEIVRPRYKL